MDSPTPKSRLHNSQGLDALCDDFATSLQLGPRSRLARSTNTAPTHQDSQAALKTRPNNTLARSWSGKGRLRDEDALGAPETRKENIRKASKPGLVDSSTAQATAARPSNKRKASDYGIASSSVAEYRPVPIQMQVQSMPKLFPGSNLAVTGTWGRVASTASAYVL